MKRLAPCLLLLFSSLAGAEGPQALAAAVKADNVCLIKGLYKLAEGARTQRQPQEQLVAACVGFDKGIGAWYLATRESAGQPTQAGAPDAQQMITRSKAMGRVFLDMASQQCEGLSEQHCLEQLNLNSKL